jgi:hypothetical protein
MPEARPPSQLAYTAHRGLYEGVSRDRVERGLPALPYERRDLGGDYACAFGGSSIACIAIASGRRPVVTRRPQN